ncbi:MAG TPA: AsmA-like C-terminal region-containing protein, partial [bacterium]|nr:AsmA-like C-terminal region-containing protein [bacterium]
RLTEMKAGAWNGAVEGVAEIDLRDPLSPGFDIRTQAKGLQANDFVSSLTPARDLVFGTLDVASSFQGKGSTPEEITKALTGNGTFSAHDGRFAKTPTIEAIWKTLNLGEQETVPFRDLLTAFAVENGRFVTDEISLQGGNAAWKASGAVSFTGELSYDIQVELNDQLSDLYRKRLGRDLANLFSGSQGRLVVDLKVRGNASKPAVMLDKDKLATRAAERAKSQVGDNLKGELQKGLNKLFGGSTKPQPPPADTSGTGGG